MAKKKGKKQLKLEQKAEFARQAKTASQAREKKSLSRRQFLIKTGLVTGGLITVGVPTILSLTSGDDWTFLSGLYEDGNQVDWGAFVGNYVPIGGMKKVGESLDSNSLRDTINKNFTPKANEFSRTQNLQGLHHLEADSQTICFPAELEWAQKMKAYCELAEEYLHTRIQGLDSQRVDWHILQKGEDFTKDFNKKGFIGFTYASSLLVHLVNNETGKKAATWESVEYRGGGGKGNITVNDEFTKSIEWYIFMGSEPYCACQTNNFRGYKI